MRKNRLELQAKLEAILGSRRVYHNPPENLKMEYPCIRYELDKILNKPADNRHFITDARYELTYITYDPDDPMVDTLCDALPYTRYDRHNVYQGLHHHVYTLYY